MILMLLWAALNVGSLSAQDAPASMVLEKYLEVKNALVKGDPKAAAAKAGELKDNFNTLDKNELSAEAAKVFLQVKDALVASARNIAATSDIEKQRLAFVSLSTNMWKLVKSSDNIDKPLYNSYCPMKKAHWISDEAAIKNPYYGKMMLTCGAVEETLNN